MQPRPSREWLTPVEVAEQQRSNRRLIVLGWVLVVIMLRYRARHKG
jgi:hypothetical protein